MNNRDVFQSVFMGKSGDLTIIQTITEHKKVLEHNKVIAIKAKNNIFKRKKTETTAAAA